MKFNVWIWHCFIYLSSLRPLTFYTTNGKDTYRIKKSSKIHTLRAVIKILLTSICTPNDNVSLFMNSEWQRSCWYMNQYHITKLNSKNLSLTCSYSHNFIENTITVTKLDKKNDKLSFCDKHPHFHGAFGWCETQKEY